MLEVANLAGEKINRGFLERVAEKTLKTIDGNKLGDISLVFVDKKKIQQINKEYRRKNEPTDVLSFEGLNEIFICPAIVRNQAERMEVSFKNELMRVLVHGILHLAGYQHEKTRKDADKMKQLEDKILQKIHGAN
jgi:probable rRNA maturation factor